MRENFGSNDERSLIISGQQGSLKAGERLVHRYQHELVRTSYLLTDSKSGAVALALRTFEQAFQGLRKLDPDSEFRPWLFNYLAGQFLHGSPVRDREDAVPSQDFLSGGTPQHFNVDNDRTRFRDALMRMDARDRLLLIFHEFNRLPVDGLARTYDRNAAELQRQLGHAQERIRQSIDIPDDRSLQVALNEAAIDAPRTDLWPELADPIEEVNNRERFRFRVLTGSVLGVVGVIILAVMVLMLNGALSSGGGDDGTSGLAPVDNPDPTSTAPLLATSAAEQNQPPYTPAGEVPDQLLAIPMRTNFGELPVQFLDAEAGVGTARPGIEGEVVGISRDGSQIYFLRHLSGSGETARQALEAVESQSLTTVWSADLSPAGPFSDDEYSVSIVTAGGVVYVATNDNLNRSIVPNSSTIQPVEIIALDQATGDELNRWPVVPSPELGSRAVNIHLFAGENPTHLILIVQQRQFNNNIETFLLRLPDMSIERQELAQIDLAFDLTDAYLSPDGRTIYQAPVSQRSQTESEPVLVRYLDVPTFDEGQITLPFMPRIAGNRFDTIVESAPSHDGRWLYVASPYDGKIAIIGTAERSLETVIPLDLGAVSILTPAELPAAVYADHYRTADPAIQLSADGLRMFMIGTAHAGEGVAATSVWEIDTTRWEVVNQWLADTPAAIQSISLSDDSRQLYASVAGPGTQEGRVFCCQMYQVDLDTGQTRITSSDGAPSPDRVKSLNDIYRAEYGQSAAIDGVVPFDNREYTVQPEVVVEILPELIEPGDQVEIQVWFRDPVDGGPVKEGDPAVRYDPATSVSILLGNESAQQLITLNPAAYGVFSARTSLTEVGFWNLDVRITSTDGDSRIISMPEAIGVAVHYQGTDGRLYQMKVVAGRAEPRQGQTVELGLLFVDAETGGSLPPGVSIADPLPEIIQLTFSVDDGSTIDPFPALLYNSGPHLFTGSKRFDLAGQLDVQATLIFNDGTDVSHPINSLFVLPE